METYTAAYVKDATKWDKLQARINGQFQPIGTVQYFKSLGWGHVEVHTDQGVYNLDRFETVLIAQRGS